MSNSHSITNDRLLDIAIALESISDSVDTPNKQALRSRALLSAADEIGKQLADGIITRLPGAVQESRFSDAIEILSLIGGVSEEPNTG